MDELDPGAVAAALPQLASFSLACHPIWSLQASFKSLAQLPRLTQLEVRPLRSHRG